MNSRNQETATAFRDMIGRPLPHTPAPALCPFCGTNEWVFIDVESGLPHDNGNTPVFRAECVECGTEGPVASSTLLAAQLWNRRPRHH